MKELLLLESNFQRGRLLVLAAFVCSFALAFSAMFFAYRIVGDLSQRIYLVNRGDAIEATCGDVADNRPAEARYHIRRFHELFFTVSPDPRSIEDNKNKALFLCDESGKRFFDNLSEQGYYREMIEGNVAQKVQVDSVKLDMRVYPYKVVAFAQLTQERATARTTRRMVTSCDLIDVNRSENSPNGFLMRNFHLLETAVLYTTNTN